MCNPYLHIIQWKWWRRRNYIMHSLNWSLLLRTFVTLYVVVVRICNIIGIIIYFELLGDDNALSGNRTLGFNCNSVNILILNYASPSFAHSIHAPITAYFVVSLVVCTLICNT